MTYLRTCAWALVSVLLLASPGWAQAIHPDRLPPDTVFFLHWRGSAAVEGSRGVNSVLRLLEQYEDDALRLFPVSPAGTSAEEREQRAEQRGKLLELLRNQALFGRVSKSAPAPGGSGQPAPPPAAGEDHSFFTLYDATGREDILREMRGAYLRQKSAEESEIQVAGVPARKLTMKTTLTEPVDPDEDAPSEGPQRPRVKMVEVELAHFDALVGSTYIYAESPQLLEALIRRFASDAAPPASLGEVFEYQQARADLDPSAALAAWYRFRAESLFPPYSGQGMNWPEFLRVLRLDRLQSLCGYLAFAGETTQLRISLLGDTGPGSFFDFFAASSPRFASTAAAPAGISSAQMFRLDFPAMYTLLREALRASLPPEEFAKVDLAEAMGMMQLGLSAEEIVALLEGELALVNGSESGSPTDFLFVLGVRDSERVTETLRAALAPFLAGEERDAAATYFTLGGFAPPSASGDSAEREGEEKKGAAPPLPFPYLAVTRGVLLAGADPAALRAAVARLGTESQNPDGSLAADPLFLRARSRLPVNLDGLTYTDLRGWFQKMQRSQNDMIDQAIGQLEQREAGEGKPLTDDEREMLKHWKQMRQEQQEAGEQPEEMGFGIFGLGRHLSLLVTGTWKDGRGFYWDVFIE